MLKLLEVLYENGTIDEPTSKLLIDAVLAEEAADQAASPRQLQPQAPAPHVHPPVIPPSTERVYGDIEQNGLDPGAKAGAQSAQARGSTVEYESGGLLVTSADSQYQSLFNGYLQIDAAKCGRVIGCPSPAAKNAAWVAIFRICPPVSSTGANNSTATSSARGAWGGKYCRHNRRRSG